MNVIYIFLFEIYPFHFSETSKALFSNYIHAHQNCEVSMHYTGKLDYLAFSYVLHNSIEPLKVQ